ncbi:MAG TPA: hypothetical protein PLE30_08430 [Candidatus Kapabacteria bacterium]|nr:hypothetical protein [Candidatus Kapabacteria bacterium]
MSKMVSNNISYGNVLKSYTVKMKAFQALGAGIIFMALIYSFGAYAPNKEALSNIILLSFISLAFGVYLLIIGNKRRTLTIFERGVEYKESTVNFSAQWEDIILLKSFQELGKKTTNLIIIKENEELLTISSAFFDSEHLINAFNYINNLKLPNITVEDDLKWLNH